MLRLNKATGSEVKITLADSTILRIQNGQPNWVFAAPNAFDPMSTSTAFTVGGPMVTVLIISSPTQIVLYENGILNFTYVIAKVSQGGSRNAGFAVQALDLGCQVDIEISCMRIIQGLEL